MAEPVTSVPVGAWDGFTSRPEWISAVESGQVLYLPDLPFALSQAERGLLAPDLLAPGSRNVSLDPQGRLKGAAGDPARQQAAAALIGRFATQARSLVRCLLPGYDAQLRAAPASLRPVAVETRRQSLRADDRRLHVDAFVTRPSRGERILRVFSNVNPEGQPRVWRVGEPFEDVARRFLPGAKPYSPWQARWLARLGLTKTLRSEYDHLMLQLHDRMKADDAYQREAPQVRFAFPPGTTWVCFSDQASHAVMSGQYLLETTFHVPVAVLYAPEASPLGILTRLVGRPLRQGQ